MHDKFNVFYNVGPETALQKLVIHYWMDQPPLGHLEDVAVAADRQPEPTLCTITH